MSKSAWDDPRITAYVLGELPEEERAAFEAELTKDAELAAAVDEVRGVTGKLQELFDAESTPPLDADRRNAILNPSAVEPSGDAPATAASQHERSWFRRHLVECCVAATILLIVGGLAIPTIESARESALSIATSDEAADFSTAQQHDATTLSEVQELETELAQAPLKYQRRNGQEGDELAAQPQQSIAERVSPEQSAAAPALAAPAVSEPESDQVPLEVRANTDARRPKLGELGLEPLTQDINRVEAAPQRTTPANKKLDAIRNEIEFEQEVGGFARRGSASDVDPVRRRTADEALLLPTATQESPYDDAIDEGRGPGIAGDQFDPITDNPFKRVSEHPLSTFSIDVDTASYSKVRDFLLRANQLPRPDAVRIEELINYFDYDYKGPGEESEHPFASHAEVTSCPWNDQHQLARIALKGREIQQDQRPRCNLVFLLDTSGSMNAPNKLPLVQQGTKMLLEQLNPDDRVAITVYAGSAGLVLDSTPAGEEQKIRRALTQLAAGGSTNGGAGIALAYQTAREHFIEDGVNRVILCTDGDFNVGTTGTDSLVRMVETEAKGGIFLSVLGFGMGNHNDAMLEQISGRGNGNYAFIDTESEARKVLVQQTSSTLVTIAKDVKLQVEFNPTRVSSYRLIGYENRVLAKEDFNDDKKDAGEIGAGHSVTALYELVSVGVDADASRPKVDPLKYQQQLELTDAAESTEWMTVKLRYKQPDADTSTLVEFPVADEVQPFDEADLHVRFAVAVAGFGMQLCQSEYSGDWTLSDVIAVAENAVGEDRFGLRAEFILLARKASELMGQENRLAEPTE